MSDSIVKILLIGSPKWVDRLSNLLNTHAASTIQAQFIAIPGKVSWKTLRAIITADLILRVGFRPGIKKLKAFLFDVWWAFYHAFSKKRRFAFYWIGSDVIATMQEFHKGKLTIFHNKTSKDRHLAGAPWFVDELREVGIEAVESVFPDGLSIASLLNHEQLPTRFSVMSYVPDKSYKSYGGEALYRAAKALPEISFDIVGGTGTWVEQPLPNLFFHGWQNDLLPFYLNASVVARIVAHDAIGGTVREALALGRHVIYTYALPYVNQVAWGNNAGLINILKELFDKHECGQLLPNQAGRKYALEEWNTAALTIKLANILLATIKSRTKSMS